MRAIDDVLLQIVTLVVDDSSEDQTTVADHLKGFGAKSILKASNGTEAISVMKSLPTPVDLIIADVRMPGGNGLQLLQAVRSGHVQGLRLNATFILATAYPEIGIIQTASALDANGFLAKPVRPEKLETAILKARRTIFPPNPGHAAVYVPEKI